MSESHPGDEFPVSEPSPAPDERRNPSSDSAGNRPEDLNSPADPNRSVDPLGTSPEVEETPNSPTPQTPRRPPGPGIPESLVWLVGFTLAQVIGLFTFVLILGVYHVFTIGLQETLRLLSNQHNLLQPPMLAGMQLMLVIFAICRHLAPSASRRATTPGLPAARPAAPALYPVRVAAGRAAVRTNLRMGHGPMARPGNAVPATRHPRRPI